MAETLADAFMQWDYAQTHEHAPVEPELGERSIPIRVIDLFSESYIFLSFLFAG